MPLSEVSSCTICSANLENPGYHHRPPELNLIKLGESINDDISGSILLSKDVDVYFILQNLLRLPSTLMEDLLGSSEGRCMTEWGLVFCSICRKIVEKAGFIFDQITKLKQEYEEVGKKIRARILVKDDYDILVGAISNMRGRGRRGKDIRRGLGSSISVVGRIREYFSQDTNRKHSTTVRNLDESIERKKLYKSTKINKTELKETEKSIAINNPQLILSYSEDTVKEEPIFIDDTSFCDEFFVPDDAQFAEEDVPCIQERSPGNHDESVTEKVQDKEDAPRRSLRPRQARKIENFESDKDNHDSDEPDDFENDSEDFDSDSEGGAQEIDDEEDDDEHSKTQNIQPSRTKVKHREYNSTSRKLPNYTRTDINSKIELQRCQYCNFSSKNGYALDAHILSVHQGVERPFPCDLCHITCDKFGAIMRHIDIRHHSQVFNEEEPVPPASGETDPSNSDVFNAIVQVKEIAVGGESENIETNFDVKHGPLQNASPLQDVDKPNEKSKRKSRTFNPAGRPFTCDKCPHRYPEMWLLNAHILRSHHGDKQPYKCDQCARRFSRHHVLFEHRADRHPTILTPYEGPSVTSFEARIAELASIEKPGIIDIPISTSKKIYTCTKCNVDFPSRISCEIHLRRAHCGPESKIKCSECDSYFLSATGKNNHFKYIHIYKRDPKGRRLLPCPECPERFKLQHDLTKHLRTHGTIKEYMCELCPQTFTAKKNLTDHQCRVHHEELGLNPWKCQICQKNLNSKRNLKHHMITHTGEFPFQCDKCPRGFVLESQVLRHIAATHNNEKPFKCSYCEKKFASKFTLSTHIRVHTGEKPYKCRFCLKDYSDRPTYCRHLETHGTKVHTCPTCQKEFKVWHTFRLHCLTHDGKGVVRRKKTTTTTRRKKQCVDYNEKGEEDDATSTSESEDEVQDSNPLLAKEDNSAQN